MFLNPRSTSMRTNKVVPVTTLCFSFVRTSVCLSQCQHSYMFILAFVVVLRHYPTMMPSLCFPPTTVSGHLSFASLPATLLSSHTLPQPSYPDALVVPSLCESMLLDMCRLPFLEWYMHACTIQTQPQTTSEPSFS